MPEQDYRQLERELRERLPTSDGGAAALELSSLLCHLERHGEAAHVLESVRDRSPDVPVTMALAQVRRGLGQRHLAVRELRGLRGRLGAIAMHPATLLELAELEWLEGDREGATATLAELRVVHAEDRWLDENRATIAAFAQEMATVEVPRRMELQDLLGNLRGAPSPLTRQRTLENLLALTRDRASPPHIRALEWRILTIGRTDPEATVRARAVQLGPCGGTTAPLAARLAFVRESLTDDAPVVRRVAAERAVRVLGEQAVGPLLEAMADAVDQESFAAIHRALCELAGRIDPSRIEPPPVREKAKTLATWRKTWGR